MAKKESNHPWQQIEEQAFHSFREWPLWLVLRQHELAQQTNRAPSRPSSAASIAKPTQKPTGN